MAEDEETPGAEAPAEKPPRAARRPARATAADGKPKAPRAASKKTEDAAAPAKPKRTRAKAADAPVQEAVAEEAPKPKAKRTRAAKPAAESADAPDAPEKPARGRKPVEPKPEPRKATRPGLRRARRKPETVGAPPLVSAQAKYVRSSARKARIVCDHIRGKSVPEARAILAFAPRGVAKDWAKLLNSAVANAEHNHELIGDDLKIKEVHADVGPTLKRFRPRAMGRATPINKRTSHLSITLTPKG